MCFEGGQTWDHPERAGKGGGGRGGLGRSEETVGGVVSAGFSTSVMSWARMQRKANFVEPLVRSHFQIADVYIPWEKSLRFAYREAFNTNVPSLRCVDRISLSKCQPCLPCLFERTEDGDVGGLCHARRAGWAASLRPGRYPRIVVDRGVAWALGCIQGRCLR